MVEDSEALFDAIQLETPRESRIEGGEEERINYGKALSRVIVMFYRKYYYNELVQSLKLLGWNIQLSYNYHIVFSLDILVKVGDGSLVTGE